MKAEKELKDIEFWEHETLENIYFTIHQDINKMIEGLNSKDKIKDDWINAFNRVDKKRQNSDFARGAERIYYNYGKENQKICLTYAINIIYSEENGNFKIKAIFIISIPNGKLYSIYGDDIIGKGKNFEKSFRFVYKNNPVFETINGKPWRVKKIFLDSDLKEEDIIGFELN